MQQDEWVVCRVFQKSAGGKKYPSNHSRAVNPFTYNLEIPQNHPMQSQMNIQPDNFQFPAGRGYMTPAEIQEFNKVFSGGAASTSMINLPIPPQINYVGGGGGGGCFTISGLNLNLGGGAAPAQPLMRAAPPPPPPGMNQQDVTSAMLNGGVAIGADHAAGYGGDMNSANTMNNRFMGIDQCADLDHYWPSY